MNGLTATGWIILLVGFLLAFIFISTPQDPGFYVVLTGITFVVIGYVKDMREHKD